MINIPGTNRTELLVLNDIIYVSINTAEQAIQTQDWQLGYSTTVHASQGLTIHNPKRVFILDNYLQWSNLAYLAVSRVEYMSQIKRVKLQKGNKITPLTPQELRKVIVKKLVSYKKVDQTKGVTFDLIVDDILIMKTTQNNLCSACNIKMLWKYEPGDSQQFSIDRIDNSRGHTKDNIRLTCLHCNRSRGSAPVINEEEVQCLQE